MRQKSRSKVTVVLAGMMLGWVSLVASMASAAPKIDAALEYPVAVGSIAQNFRSNFGFGSTLTLDPVLADELTNYLSVSYASFTLESDPASSFRLVPLIAGIGLPGKIADGLTTEIGIGIGAAISYVNAPGATSYRSYGYFAGQFRAKVEYEIASGISIFFRMPVTYIVGRTSMSYLAYTVGAGFQF